MGLKESAVHVQHSLADKSLADRKSLPLQKVRHGLRKSVQI